MSVFISAEGHYQTLANCILGVWPECCGVGLFGSVAKGTAHANSDIDILIVLPPETRIVRSL